MVETFVMRKHCLLAAMLVAAAAWPCAGDVLVRVESARLTPSGANATVSLDVFAQVTDASPNLAFFGLQVNLEPSGIVAFSGGGSTDPPGVHPYVYDELGYAPNVSAAGDSAFGTDGLPGIGDSAPLNDGDGFFRVTIDVPAGTVGAFDLVVFEPGNASVLAAPGGVTIPFGVEHGRLIVGMAGDLNLDGTVNFAEAAAAVANIGLSDATWADGDVNLDGVVDLSEAQDAVANIGHSANMPAAPLAVPEPAGLVLVLSALVLPRRRRM